MKREPIKKEPPDAGLPARAREGGLGLAARGPLRGPSQMFFLLGDLLGMGGKRIWGSRIGHFIKNKTQATISNENEDFPHIDLRACGVEGVKESPVDLGAA